MGRKGRGFWGGEGFDANVGDLLRAAESWVVGGVFYWVMAWDERFILQNGKKFFFK